MQGSRRPLYPQRINRDIAELFAYNFSCSSSCLFVTHEEQCTDKLLFSINLNIFEGPYRGGSFNFSISIPDAYPFKSADICAMHHIWHPNIDFHSGRVNLPLEWSPVITLVTLIVAVQVLMLEPSTDNPLNIEAYTMYTCDNARFDTCAQMSLTQHSAPTMLAGAVRAGSTASGIPQQQPQQQQQQQYCDNEEDEGDIQFSSSQERLDVSAHVNHQPQQPQQHGFASSVFTDVAAAVGSSSAIAVDECSSFPRLTLSVGNPRNLCGGGEEEEQRAMTTQQQQHQQQQQQQLSSSSSSSFFNPLGRKRRSPEFDTQFLVPSPVERLFCGAGYTGTDDITGTDGCSASICDGSTGIRTGAEAEAHGTSASSASFFLASLPSPAGGENGIRGRVESNSAIDEVNQVFSAASIRSMSSMDSINNINYHNNNNSSLSPNTDAIPSKKMCLTDARLNHI